MIAMTKQLTLSSRKMAFSSSALVSFASISASVLFFVLTGSMGEAVLALLTAPGGFKLAIGPGAAMSQPDQPAAKERKCIYATSLDPKMPAEVS
jgi:predicted naringenin-chalcone synthase